MVSPRWLAVGFHDIGQGGEEVAVDAPLVWAGLAWRRDAWSNRSSSRWLRGDDGECKVPGRSTGANHWGRILEYRLGSCVYFEISRDTGEVESSTPEYLVLEAMGSRDLNLLVIHRASFPVSDPVTASFRTQALCAVWYIFQEGAYYVVRRLGSRYDYARACSCGAGGVFGGTERSHQNTRRGILTTSCIRICRLDTPLGVGTKQ